MRASVWFVDASALWCPSALATFLHRNIKLYTTASYLLSRTSADTRVQKKESRIRRKRDTENEIEREIERKINGQKKKTTERQTCKQQDKKRRRKERNAEREQISCSESPIMASGDVGYIGIPWDPGSVHLAFWYSTRNE